MTCSYYAQPEHKHDDADPKVPESMPSCTPFPMQGVWCAEHGMKPPERKVRRASNHRFPVETCPDTPWIPVDS